ncbi:MAG: hypothetical protein WA144_03070 [Candidatus Methanoperedens sp.]
MKGNFHVRFLEEEERATALLYSGVPRSTRKKVKQTGHLKKMLRREQ